MATPDEGRRTPDPDYSSSDETTIGVPGFTVHAVGWTAFFWMTMLAGIPGLLLLARFVPPGMRDPHFTVEPPRSLDPLSPAALGARAVAGGLAGTGVALAVIVSLQALDAVGDGQPFEWTAAFIALFRPESFGGWFQLLGAAIFGVASALLAAAVAAARHGARV